jgi:Cu-processing system permease protein
MYKIIKYVMVDILRSRIILAYTVFLLAISLSLFNLEDNASKGLLSMLNIVLLIVPLVSLIFSTIYMYNASEFIELLVSQPIHRRRIIISLYTGLCLSLLLAFVVGAGLPVILLNGSSTAWMMVITACALTAIFSSLAVLGSVITRDKAKGIGIAILLWLYFSLLYDGILLLAMFQLADYPLEKPMMIACSLNPVDLARIIVLLQMDVSALMGYTGALYQIFFGTSTGIIFSLLMLTLWFGVPLFVAQRKFARKDL